MKPLIHIVSLPAPEAREEDGFCVALAPACRCRVAKPPNLLNFSSF
jgi:hypothetical protein